MRWRLVAAAAIAVAAFRPALAADLPIAKLSSTIAGGRLQLDWYLSLASTVGLAPETAIGRMVLLERPAASQLPAFLSAVRLVSITKLVSMSLASKAMVTGPTFMAILAPPAELSLRS